MFPKILEDLNIYDNHILYIEQQNNEQELQWVNLYQNEQHRLTIKYNLPQIKNEENKEDDQVQQGFNKPEFPYTLQIDSRQQVQDLKAKICKELNVNPEEIVMRRGGCQGQEIKEGKTKNLKEQHFVSGSSIYLEFGQPAKEGEYRLIVSYATNSDLQNDQVFHEFQEVGEIPINGMLTSQKAAVILCEKIKQILNIELDPKHVRLREKASNRLSKIYRNKPLKGQQLIDKKMIAVEPIGQEQNLNSNQFLVYIRIWNQQEWKLSDRFEVIISKSDSGSILAKSIYEQDQSINIENMVATRINAIWNFNIYDLLSCEWSNVNNSDNMLGSQPFYLMNDGYLLIIKDKTQEPRELSEQEIKQMGITVVKHNKPNKKTYRSFKEVKEKSLHITVKKKQSSQNSEQLINDVSQQQNE